MPEAKAKISVFIAASVDGFIARPDGDVDWLSDVEPMENGDDGGYSAFFDTVDVLVMGRHTFEKVLTFDGWPYGEKPVIVLSSTRAVVPDELSNTVTTDSGSPQELVQKFARAGYRHIYLDGGKTIQAFLAAGLVDELTITRIPILLGQGLPLFGELNHDLRLRLIENQSWSNGFVQSRYQVLNG